MNKQELRVLSVLAFAIVWFTSLGIAVQFGKRGAGNAVKIESRDETPILDSNSEPSNYAKPKRLAPLDGIGELGDSARASGSPQSEQKQNQALATSRDTANTSPVTSSQDRLGERPAPITQVTVPVATPNELIPPTSLSAREWSSANQKFKTKAELLDFRDGSVSLKRVDGKTVKVELKRLSSDDQDYLGGLLREDDRNKVIFGVPQSGHTREELTFVAINDEKHSIVLAGVVLPNLSSDKGQELLGQYYASVYDKAGWIEVIGTDSIGRKIVVFSTNEGNINLKLISSGIAWFDHSSLLGARYLNAEYIARTAKLGVWNSNLKRPDLGDPK